MNKTFFYLGPYVYINKYNDSILLYNTINGEHILFNKNETLNKIIENMGSDSILSVEIENVSKQKNILN